jgi:putative transposase
MPNVAHKIRLNPTAEQEEFFRRSVGTVRFAWNWARDEYLAAIKADRKPDSALTLKKRFNGIKGVDFPWTAEVSGRCTEYGFARFGRALNNYYSSKKGERKGAAVRFPKVKSRNNNRQSFYIANTGVRHDGHSLKIPRLDTPVNMAEPLRFEGKVNSVVVSTEGDGRWYASFSMEIEQPDSDTAGLPIVGVDLGSRALATVYDGCTFTQYDPGDFQKRELKKLRRLNRRLARRVKGSNGWKEAKKDLNRLHNQIKSQRQDYIHKLTTEIVLGASVVIIEDLHVKGMMRNRSVARTIADAAMGETKRQLIYKCELYGRQLIMVDRFYPSSKTCSCCTAVNAELGSGRTWTCDSCETVHDRDENAAVNIRSEGIRQL